MDETTKKLLDRKFILLFEIAKRSLLAADHLVAQVARDLASFESDIDRGTELGDRAISPLLDAVAFVDFAFRFHGVVQSLPFVKKDAPEMKRLDGALQAVEDSRHHLQHMRGDLSKNEEIDYPLLGALSWASERTAYTVWFSQPGSATVPGVAFDTLEMRWVSKHIFVVKHVEIDLDRTLAEMHTAYSWLSKMASSSYQEVTELKWGQTIAMASRFDFAFSPSEKVDMKL